MQRTPFEQSLLHRFPGIAGRLVMMMVMPLGRSKNDGNTNVRRVVLSNNILDITKKWSTRDEFNVRDVGRNRVAKGIVLSAFEPE